MSQFNAQIDCGTSLTVVVDTTPYTFDSGHPNFAKLREAVRKNDVTTFLSLIDIPKAINNVLQNSSTSLVGSVRVENDTVYYNDQPLHNSLTKRMLDMVRGGFDVKPLVKFLENLMQNPSKRAVDELYSFLEHGNLPITNDGCFIAYKAVKNNYLDKYSGKFDNRPGSVLEMPRNQVDDDANATCSYGFHVGALEYSGPSGWYHSMGDRVILVKVNPADAVSVPADHNAQKLRVCKYVVIGDYKSPLNKPVYSGNEVNDEHYCNDEYCHDPRFDEAECCVSICVDDLEEGDEISFEYTKISGEKGVRHLRVEDVDHIDEVVSGVLIYPEDKAGEYRQFHMCGMNDIQFAK